MEINCKAIIESRWRANLTQEALAEKTGLTQRIISNIETGKKRNPTICTVYKIAKALEIPLELFIAD